MQSFGQHLRGKPKTLQKIPAKTSVSKINYLIRKRLETSYHENQVSASETDLDSLSADRYLECDFIVLTFWKAVTEGNFV